MNSEHPIELSNTTFPSAPTPIIPAAKYNDRPPPYQRNDGGYGIGQNNQDGEYMYRVLESNRPETGNEEIIRKQNKRKRGKCEFPMGSLTTCFWVLILFVLPTTALILILLWRFGLL